MSYLAIAKLIPDYFRTKILTENNIYKAVVNFEDVDMMKLWCYWKSFIEPDNEQYDYKIVGGKIIVPYNCLVCLRSLYDKWLLIEPYLIFLEKQKNLLQGL